MITSSERQLHLNSQLRLKSRNSLALYKDFQVGSEDDNSSENQRRDHFRRINSRSQHIRDFNKRMQPVKMTILILIPCIGLTAMTVSSLITNAVAQKQANQVKLEIASSIQLGDLIHRLQIERGQTVLYVSTNYDNFIFKSLFENRTLTNQVIDAIQPWPKLAPNLSASAYYLANRTAIRRYLDYHRDKVVDIHNTTALDELLFYSKLNNQLLNWISGGIQTVQTDHLWNTLAAYQMLLKGTEETGLERAIGSVYYSQIQLSYPEILLYYSKLQLGNLSLASAIQYSSYIADGFKNMAFNSSMMKKLQNLRNVIAENVPHTPSITKANYWFAHISIYIDQLKIIQDNTAHYIQSQSSSTNETASKNFILSLILLITVIIICPILIYLTVKLTQSIQAYAVNLATKTKKLRREKVKTDALLCEMLPRSIAERLKHGQDILAEKFDNVTIYFSNIVRFEQICHQSSAIEIIEMLNNLYVLFDVQIEKHNVYKVETIGDVYMVVSGLPKKLAEDRHAIEIAEMALDLLHSLKKAQLSHKLENQIQLRAGIHSGKIT